jgi:hypothetical protein
VTGTSGMRVGFDYPFTDPGTNMTSNVTQAFLFSFDDGSPGVWTDTPPDCTSTSTTICANDPNTDPATWKSFQPAQVQAIRTVDGSTAVPVTPTTSSWITSHARLWVWSHHISATVTKYYWRVNMAMPVRTSDFDPQAAWTSQSIYVHPDAFKDIATKNVPNFWAEIVTDAIDGTPKTIYHFPDWTGADMRDNNNVPLKSLWGRAEIGTPRGIPNTGDIPCTGQGVLVKGTTGDNVVWHSAIWNNKTDLTAATDNYAFSLAGTLKMYDSAANVQFHNNMSVMLNNEGADIPSTSNVHATFLVAPYGSQAPSTIWSALNAGDSSTNGGNSYKCVNPGATTTGNHQCVPQMKPFPAIDSTPATSGVFSAASDLQLNMSQDWVPSWDYACAVQTSDNPSSLSWWWGNGALTQKCASAVWLPNDTTSTSPDQISTGLPAHQCMQVQLTGTQVQFAVNSAFRNMHVAPASLYRETATIDTRGLAKLKNQGYHNIYLYVETRNMPDRDDAGYAPPTIGSTMQTYTNINRYCGRIIEAAKQQGKSLASISDGIDCRGYDPSVPVPSDDFLTQRMPTMIVHAYADTGVTQTIRGKKVPILTPMTSFGQYVTHDATTEGNVFGWNAGLEPSGTTPFQKVGIDTYRIQIPNDGVGHVITRVEPLPTKRPVCSGTVNMDIVSLLKAIAPLIKVDGEDANEINALVDSLQIECVPLFEILTKIDAMDWGAWKSWVHYLITQVEATDGCHCK